MLTLYTDGGSRGNPGEAAIGVVIINGRGDYILTLGKRIGIATNNVAEYEALLAGLDWLVLNKETVQEEKSLQVFLDSLLLVSQANGLYKVKSPHLRVLLIRVKENEQALGIPVVYTHVSRSKNVLADRLVNRALDNKL